MRIVEKLELLLPVMIAVKTSDPCTLVEKFAIKLLTSSLDAGIKEHKKRPEVTFENIEQ